MKRKILIITNPGIVGAENYCKGVYNDAINYMTFFTAPYGGLWDIENEIISHDQPTRQTILNEIRNLSYYDFSIIIFCGHGWYSSQSESNILELKDKEYLDSDDLRYNSNKRIIILDNYKKVLPDYIFDSLLQDKALIGDLAGFNLNPQLCKAMYIKRVEECSQQLIVSYASKINQLAGENERIGGYYTSSLIKASKNWVDVKSNSIVSGRTYNIASFPFCHENSIPRVIELSGNTQHPQIEKPRVSDSKDYLPFAVVA